MKSLLRYPGRRAFRPLSPEARRTRPRIAPPETLKRRWMWGWQSPSSRRVVESRRAPSPRRCSGQTRGGLGGVGGDRAGTGSQGSPGKAAPRIGHWGRDGREGGDLGRPTDKDALHRKGEGTGDEGEGRSAGDGRSDPDRKKIRGPRSQGGNAFNPEVGRTPRAGGSEHAKGKSTGPPAPHEAAPRRRRNTGLYTLYCV